MIQADYITEYWSQPVSVKYDEQKGLKYILDDGKRLYYCRDWSEEQIIHSYRNQAFEQDPRSGHCYFRDMSIYPNEGVFVDIGGAEGNFALRLVEKASKIFIFESEECWIEPLNATFEPWKDKVFIINKYVSDKVNEKEITLEMALRGENRIDVVKMDIEGAETTVIANSLGFFDKHPELTIVACAYHNDNDEKEIKEIMEGYSVKEQGWVCFSVGSDLHPFLRRVLLFAKKQV